MRKVVFDDNDELEYLVLNTATHEYDAVSSENADYIRIGDEPTYDDKKNIDKSWVGEITVNPSDPKFPTVHLKNEKPEEKITIVTIDKTKLRSFFTSSNWTRYVSSFKEVDKSELQSRFPELLDSDGNFNLNPTGNWVVRDCKDTSAEHSDETGKFYVWRKTNSSQGTDYYWYSDANIKYMPEDCSDLFKDLSNLENDGSALDLSEFDFSNVSNVNNMFNNCSKITQITFPQGGNVTVDSCVNMFNNCRLLELTAQGTAVSDTDTAQDSDEMNGQTSFFDKKSNHYSET